MRRLLVVSVVLLALLLVADRVGAALAGRAIAAELQSSGMLPARPDVTVGGFPFLTQALGGQYRSIDVEAADVPAEQVTLRALSAELEGVEVPLSDALSGQVGAVPVERVEARVLLGYDDLSRRSGDRELTVSPDGDRLRVRGSARVLGREVMATAVSRVELEGDEVVVTAESYDLGNSTANALVTRALEGGFDYRFRLTGLPYGLEVTGLQVRPDGLSVTATAADTVLSPR